MSHPLVMMGNMTFTYVPAIPPTASDHIDLTDSPRLAQDTPTFSVTLTSGRIIDVADATTYEPEGPLTTFFQSGSSSRTIDVWSVRMASFRTADIVSIRQWEEPTTRHPSAQNLDTPVLSLVAG